MKKRFASTKRSFRGQITVLRKHADAPNPHLPPDWKDKILHGRVEVGNATLMGADIPDAQPIRSAYVSLTVDSVAEAERLYGVLQQGGEIFMRMEEAFFAKRFAMLRDRFGRSWMLLHAVREG